MTHRNDELSIVLCGEAGQGIQTVELLLTRILKFAGYNVFATKEYMSRVRGGANSTEIRVSARRISSFVNRIDILIPLSKGSAKRLEHRTSSETIILGEKETVDDLDVDSTIEIVPFTDIASEVGNKLYSNTVATGVIAGLLNIEGAVISDYIKKFFSKKDESVINHNIEAAKKGYEIGETLRNKDNISIAMDKNNQISDEILINGAEAVGLGALSGGCTSIFSYPMSPSTGVLVFWAQHAHEMGIVAEQAEDEIAAVNMAIGAWYAGGRAMATTSGGGFALMIEGVSLAGMLETPLVIHIGQRPGPATGLPTRTEQADLELVLYAGHGEFPRVILAPGNLEDAFLLTRKAFNLADKFQSPVFILTDQYFLDSYYNIPSLPLDKESVKKHIIETREDYKRYNLTDNGISPRGIPGHGKGLVAVDSDEHDEEGHITEDMRVRTRMVNKRLKKLDLMREDEVAPELAGAPEYSTLIVGWGSTYHTILEAIGELGRDDVAFLHFKQVYPLPGKTAEYLQKAERVIAIENNATGQFARLIHRETGYEIKDKIVHYNGLPFSVEDIVKQMKSMLS